MTFLASFYSIHYLLESFVIGFRLRLGKLLVSSRIYSLIINILFGFIGTRKAACISLRSLICGLQIGMCLILQAFFFRSFCGALCGCWQLMGREFWGRRM